jgi:hypothetical protein
LISSAIFSKGNVFANSISHGGTKQFLQESLIAFKAAVENFARRDFYRAWTKGLRVIEKPIEIYVPSPGN